MAEVIFKPAITSTGIQTFSMEVEGRIYYQLTVKKAILAMNAVKEIKRSFQVDAIYGMAFEDEFYPALQLYSFDLGVLGVYIIDSEFERVCYSTGEY